MEKTHGHVISVMFRIQPGFPMNKLHSLTTLILFLALPSFTMAKLCHKCSRLAYIQAIGECPKCKGFTRSAAHKLCGKCSVKENKCQNCLVALGADTGKKPQKILKGPSGKAYPTHWGAPPLRQTRDLRPLPDGYGRGSSTLARWIQENLDKDADGGKPFGKRPAVSRAFAAKHPTGSYSEGDLLLGMKNGLSKEACQNALAEAIPGLEIKKSMFNNTILHVQLPDNVNVEQAMAKLKAVKAVKYSELNGRIGIQPRPQPIQIQPVPVPEVRIRPVPVPPRPPDLVAPAPRPDPVAPPVFRPSGGGPVDKAKVDQLKKSLGAWEKLKEECGGNYTYSKRWSSWVGFGHKTEVVVANNKVVERRFKSFPGRPRVAAPGQPPTKPEGKSWIEKGKELGSHKEGHPAKTLDELYKEAIGILDRPLPPFQRLGLRFDKQGLLLACYTQDRRIADDAPTKGVSISEIKLGKGGGETQRKEKNEKKGLRINKTSNGKTINVEKGETIQISLEGNPTTGFSWNDTTKSTQLKFEKMTTSSSRQLVGSPGVFTATYRAVKMGSGTISLEYKRVFEKKPPVETFQLKVVVLEADAKASPPVVDANNEIQALEKRIAKMKDFAKRARFTPDGHQKFQAELATLEKQLADLLARHALANPKPIKPGVGRKPFPKHWGTPPRIQTKDLRPLPAGYGVGSSTLAGWIRKNMERDRKLDQRGD